MRFEIFTLFPEYFDGPLHSSILKRAQESGVLQFGIHNIRDWADDKHNRCDDYPYGGGAGMVMKAAPLASALESVLTYDAGDVEHRNAPPCPVVFLSPHGRTLTHKIATELTQEERLALVCGHYEGVDERALDLLTTDAISVGDYVLTGGEPAAAILVDCVARLLPGVLGNEESAQSESFADGLLEAPHYTRPASWRGYDVPKVLLSGHHGEVEKWRLREGMKKTLQHRPDLLDAILYGGNLSADELKILGQVLSEFPLR
jgi:tRNA (guanine37-N1)-methyltransferase